MIGWLVFFGLTALALRSRGDEYTGPVFQSHGIGQLNPLALVKVQSRKVATIAGSLITEVELDPSAWHLIESSVNEIPFFDGWPPEYKAQAVPVWVDGQPEPWRFANWRPMWSLDEMQAKREFMRRYWFAVLTSPTELGFYVLAKPVPHTQCCEEVERSETTAVHGTWGWENEYEARGGSGMPPPGEGWICTKRPAECFEALDRIPTTHPRARTKPPLRTASMRM